MFWGGLVAKARMDVPSPDHFVFMQCGVLMPEHPSDHLFDCFLRRDALGSGLL